MLNMLRKKKVMKKIVWGLALIIIPAFILWGAGSAVRSKFQGYSYAGKISNKKVSFKDFVESQRGMRVQLVLNYFNQAPILNKLIKDRPLINKLAWERLIMLDEAKKRNITVSDEEVVEFITNHPLFLRKTGFDKRLYTQILKNNMGITPRTFEEKIRENAVIGKLRDSIVKDVSVSDGEVRDAYQKEHEKAKISFILIGKNKFKDKIDIPENGISDFYKENSDKFISPEEINVEYIAFKYETLEEKEIAINNLIDIYTKIQKDPSGFKKIARANNAAPEETGFFAKTEISPEVGWDQNFYNAAFRLRKGEFGQPVIPEGEKGTCYILRVKDIMPSRKKTLDEARDTIINILKERKAMELSKEDADVLYKRAQSDRLTLRDLVRTRFLEIKNTNFVSRADYIEGLGESYLIVDEAFKLKPGEISEPIPSRAGYIIISPEKFLTIDEEKFESEKEDYEKKVLAVKKMRALDEWFNGISKNAELVVDLDRL